ncbi:hypothetical protein F511_44441 [Dorcoceras hygrometricum]|uniref:Uncharacterized protein n=1 Tax=Dorcoceras hygrometricum TaxID=472368 RepID=A0A2Z6ZXY4_9LAMI|nr:hypothetical protein F511_44441 [Dorcoceras hygrometricum]
MPGTGPNKTLEEISHHDIVGASPDDGRTAAANKSRAAATSAALPWPSCAATSGAAANDLAVMHDQARTSRPLSSSFVAQPSAASVLVFPIRALALIPLLGNRGGSRSRLPARQRKNKIRPGNAPGSDHFSRGNRHFTVDGGRLRQSGPRPEGRLLHQPALESLTRSARTDSSRQVGRNKFRRSNATAAAQGGGGGGF